MDTERVSAASDAVVSRETCKISEGVPTVVPKSAAAPQASSEVTQPRPPESGCTDLLPPVNDCRESLGLGTPDAVESGMEVAGGIPPAEIDISVNPDMLPDISDNRGVRKVDGDRYSGYRGVLRTLVTLAWIQMCYRQ